MQAQIDNTARVALQAYELVGAALGLFITYLAYRGYRRNDSRPMLYLALGFGIIFGLAVPVFGLSLVFPALSPVVSQVFIQTFEIIGFLCIIYALRMEP